MRPPAIAASARLGKHSAAPSAAGTNSSLAGASARWTGWRNTCARGAQVNNLISPTFAAELLKATRDRWVTCEQIAEETDTNIKSTRKWVDVWVDYGVLVDMPGESGKHRGRTARKVTLSKEWGGKP